MANASASHITKFLHRKPYAAIDPSRPELSQRGRVVLITGSSAGIGFAIARGFAKAEAATVIMTGRRDGPLNEAVNKLKVQYPRTTFIGKTINMANSAETRGLWGEFDVDGLVVDVLVLNAARIQSKAGSMLELGHKEVFADFITNVGANMEFTDYFYHQTKRDTSKKLALLNVSTNAIHDFSLSGALPNYSASKNAGTMLMQQIAKGVPVNEMQVISFHPGAIFTSAAKEAGYTESTLNWDDEDLPGHYAVWAASDEAAFLHGRFIWAAWDIDELRNGEIRQRIDSDPNYLKVGVVGL